MSLNLQTIEVKGVNQAEKRKWEILEGVLLFHIGSLGHYKDTFMLLPDY